MCRHSQFDSQDSPPSPINNAGMLQWNVKSSLMPNLPSPFPIFSELPGFSSNRGQSMKFRWSESFTFFLYLRLPPHSCFSPLDSCGIAAPPVTTLSSFSTSARLSFTKYQTEVAVWLLNTCRHCFARPRQGKGGGGGGGGCSHCDSCWGVINNICPGFKISSHWRRKWEREGAGEVPFLKFTWTCVQKAWRGRAALKGESLPPRHKWLLDTALLRADSG